MEFIMSLTIGKIVGGLAAAVGVISIFVEFSKKIEKFPITALLNWIGSRINHVLLERVDGLEKKVDGMKDAQATMEEQFAEKDAINCRIRILNFSDELRRGVEHSKESFDQALSDMDSYEYYCRTHEDFKNNKTVIAEARIKEAYKSCLDKDNFL